MPSPKSKAPKARISLPVTANVLSAVEPDTYTACQCWPLLNKLDRAAARARLRWERLSEEEKVEAMCKAGYEVQGVKRLAETWEEASLATKINCREVCRAILSLQSSPAKGGREK